MKTLFPLLLAMTVMVFAAPSQSIRSEPEDATRSDLLEKEIVDLIQKMDAIARRQQEISHQLSITKLGPVLELRKLLSDLDNNGDVIPEK